MRRVQPKKSKKYECSQSEYLKLYRDKLPYPVGPCTQDTAWRSLEPFILHLFFVVNAIRDSNIKKTFSYRVSSGSQTFTIEYSLPDPRYSL